MNEKHPLEEKITGSAPQLDAAEKALLWQKIAVRLPAPTPTPSPYWFNFTTKKHMAPIALALMLMLGGTGVVAAAETARPGDSLFVIEQKIEDLRLALASDDKKTQLEAKFAAERLLELSSILNESIEQKDSSSATSTGTQKRNLTLSSDSEVRVNKAVAITLGYLLNGSFGDDEREELLKELSVLIEGVPVQLSSDRIRIKDTNTWVEVRNNDDDSRLEIRDGNDRIRIREKDGELRIDTKGDFDDLFEDDDWDDDRLDDRDDDSDDRDDRDEFEAEADIFSDRTIVKVELDDREYTFETKADSRAGIVAEISNRFDISESAVNAALDLEIEDRSSRASDKEDDRDDDDIDEKDDDEDNRDDDSDDRDDDDDDNNRLRISL